jgi:hypothetical protein
LALDLSAVILKHSRFITHKASVEKSTEALFFLEFWIPGPGLGMTKHPGRVLGDPHDLVKVARTTPAIVSSRK